MFELDYLTQRLTFARATDTTNPRLIGGYAPTFEGDVEVLPVDNGEPLAAELDGVPRRRPRRRPTGRRRRGWPLGRRDRRCAAASRQRAPDRGAACPRESPATRPPRRPRASSAAPSRCLPTRAAMNPHASGHAVDRRARHGRDRRRRRRRQDGPAAGRPVRLPRLVRHRGRRGPGASSRASTRVARTSARNPVSPSSSPRPTPPAVCARPSTAPRRPAPRMSSCSSCRSCSTTSRARITGSWTRPSRRSCPGVHAGSLVIFETTLPVGDTRGRYAPRLAEASGLTLEEDLFVAFSPERLYSGAALRNLATYPKLVGGLGEASTARARRVLRQRPRRGCRRDVLRRGRRVRQARRYDLPRRQHRAGQRVRRATRTGSAWTSARSSPRPTASRTATSTSPASASVATASRSTRTSCSTARRSSSSWRSPAGSTTARWTSRSGRCSWPWVALDGVGRPRPRPDLPGRGQGTGLLAGLPARRATRLPRGARVARLRPAADGRGDRPDRRDAVDLGRRPPPASRAIVTQTADPPGPTLDPAWFPAPGARLRRPELPARAAAPGGVTYQGVGQRG